MRIIYPKGIKLCCDGNKITYKHLSYRLNVQDEFKVEMLISVSRSVLPSNGKHYSEIKKELWHPELQRGEKTYSIINYELNGVNVT